MESVACPVLVIVNESPVMFVAVTVIAVILGAVLSKLNPSLRIIDLFSYISSAYTHR
ncbi:hypothetical protein D3C80_1679960 [compost metagenome]